MNLTKNKYYFYNQFISELEIINPKWKEELRQFILLNYDGHGKFFSMTIEDIWSNLQSKELSEFLEKEFENETEIVLRF